jgi:hypothetical protein
MSISQIHPCGCTWHQPGGLEGYGHYELHYCRVDAWFDGAQDALDKATSLAELRDIWIPLATAGKVDALGGAEWHHAVAHMYFLIEHPGHAVTAHRQEI